MSHPKWFKIGGFRLRDFRAALEIEEQTLATVNRQVQLQLTRLREEYDVLVRRKEKLDREIAVADELAGTDGLDAKGDGDHEDSRDRAPPGEGRQERTAPATRKRRPDEEPEHGTGEIARPKRKTYHCTHCKNVGHNIRKCPDRGKKNEGTEEENE